jgi:hypothetical protein
LSLLGTTQQACDLLEVERSTLTVWKNKGLDAYVNRNQWDLTKLVTWWSIYIVTPSDPDDTTLQGEKLRYERGRADKIEIEVEKMKKDLLPRAEVQAALSELITIAKKAFLLLPKTVPGRLKGKTDPEQIRILQNIVEAILLGISRGAKIEKIETTIKSFS